MKRFLIFFATVCMWLHVSAQTQSAFIDVVKLLGGAERYIVEGGTVLASSENVTMITASAHYDYYSVYALHGEDDAVDQLVIGGVTYPCPSGIFGETNPSDVAPYGLSCYAGVDMTNGTAFRFDVTADGWLYVISKPFYNKGYYVWGGKTEKTLDVKHPWRASFNSVAYNLTTFSKTDGTKSTYTLPSLTGDYAGLFCADYGSKLADGASEYITPIYWRKGSVCRAPGYKRITWDEYESDAALRDSVDLALKEEGVTLYPRDGDGADPKYLYRTVTVSSLSFNEYYYIFKEDGATRITWKEYSGNDEVKVYVNNILKAENLTLAPKVKDSDYLTARVIELSPLYEMLGASDCCVAYGSQPFNAKQQGFGVIAFQVKQGYSYLVYGRGTRLVTDGFVFIPGATSIATISASKSGSEAVKDVTLDDREPTIYNLLGQRVSEGYKGICIRNGKKVLVK